MNEKIKIVIGSYNTGKIREFKNILKDNDNLDLLTLNELNIKEKINETGSTFEENAFIKANKIYEKTNISTIADDSGLEIEYLNGAPGIMSARFGGENASDQQKIEKILKKMENAKVGERKARFIASIVLILKINDIKKIIKIREECEGEIGFKPVGNNGFGYDPIFIFNGKTFAEMSAEEKDQVSHRGKALRKLKSILDYYQSI